MATTPHCTSNAGIWSFATGSHRRIGARSGFLAGAVASTALWSGRRVGRLHGRYQVVFSHGNRTVVRGLGQPSPELHDSGHAARWTGQARPGSLLRYGRRTALGSVLTRQKDGLADPRDGTG